MLMRRPITPKRKNKTLREGTTTKYEMTFQSQIVLAFRAQWSIYNPFFVNANYPTIINSIPITLVILYLDVSSIFVIIHSFINHSHTTWHLFSPLLHQQAAEPDDDKRGSVKDATDSSSLQRNCGISLATNNLLHNPRTGSKWMLRTKNLQMLRGSALKPLVSIHQLYNQHVSSARLEKRVSLTVFQIRTRSLSSMWAYHHLLCQSLSLRS